MVRILFVFVFTTFCSVANANWVEEFENTIKLQQQKFEASGLPLNDRKNYDYAKITNPIFNGLATANTRIEVAVEDYYNLLVDVFKNNFRYSILEDHDIKLQALMWLFNLKNKCFDSTQHILEARLYLDGLDFKDDRRHRVINVLIAIDEQRDIKHLLDLIRRSDNKDWTNFLLDNLRKTRHKKIALEGLYGLLVTTKKAETRSHILNAIGDIRETTFLNKCNMVSPEVI